MGLFYLKSNLDKIYNFTVLFKQPFEILVKRVRGERKWADGEAETEKQRRLKNMGKIVGFVLASIGLSLAILIPTYYFFDIITVKVKQVGVFQDAIAFLWQGFALIVFVVVISIGTLMALIIFGGEKNVV